MLRTSLRSVRGPGGRAVAGAAGRQWQAAVARPARATIGNRTYADNQKFGSSIPQPAIIPSSETRTAAASRTPGPATPKTIPADEVPRTTPPPPSSELSSSAASSAKSQELSSPPPQPPPLRKKKGFFQRLRNYVLTLSLLGALAFGGGVWYSRVNDTFHDFFTEYVPFGEQAVLYLEEMDFRKRFPRIAQRHVGGGGDGKAGPPKVKIPAQSGASWRVADGPEPIKRQSSAVKDAKAAAALNPDDQKAKGATPSKPGVAPKEESPAAVDAASIAKPPQPLDQPIPPPASVIQEPPAKDAAASPPPEAKKSRRRSRSSSLTPEQAAFKPPEVDEPSRWPPASPIDPLAVKDASEPVVQDLVRMLNDIIAVINADGANEKYGGTVGKAKQEVNTVGRKIRELKLAAEEEAASKVKEQVENLEKHATDLIDRLEAHMAEQEKAFRAEFGAELARVKASYDERVRVMTERERQINEQKLENRLLEQALELQRRFAAEVRERVETERDGRLGQLEALSSAVAELDKLAAGLAGVVDAAKRAQQLHVAVEAVRAGLEASSAAGDSPAAARPFVRELVALKEVAAGDPVVDAAIASINPSAYQRGVASPAELVDRFRRVAAEVRKAALLPADAGVASHASSWVLSKIMFQKRGLADGDDVESVLARAQTLLEEGDLDAATREVNGLQGWAKVLSRDWLAEARKVLEVQQALDVIQTEARLQSLKLEQ